MVNTGYSASDSFSWQKFLVLERIAHPLFPQTPFPSQSTSRDGSNRGQPSPGNTAQQNGCGHLHFALDCLCLAVPVRTGLTFKGQQAIGRRKS